MELMIMSTKERQQKVLFEMVRLKKLTLVQAAAQSEQSYRQTLRAYKRYKAEGDAGLTHKGRGRRSNRKNPHQEAIIARYQTRYEGFGPTLAAEYLAKDGLIIDHETLRRLLLSKGLWKKQRKRSPYRQRREPRAQFGELVQIDGSIHDWLGLDCHDCLLNMVDDATSKSEAILDTGETTRVVFLAIRRWIERYGIPLAIYVDLKTVYVSPKETGFSHVQIACSKLGIRIVKARSPQAKGRVERNHAVYQDRFVKELSLQGIKTITEANAVLDDGFIDHLNSKFEKPARNPESAHRPLGDIDLEQVFCWEYKRQIQHDWTFSFNAKCYQVSKIYGSHLKPKNMVIVRKHLDHSISVWHDNNALDFNIVRTRQPISVREVEAIPKLNRPKQKTPWSQTNSFIFEKVQSLSSKVTLKKRNV